MLPATYSLTSMLGAGKPGHVALFQIEGKETVTVLAIRYQREDDFQ